MHGVCICDNIHNGIHDRRYSVQVYIILYISCVVFCPLQKAVRVPSQVTGLSLSKAVSSKLSALLANWTIPQSDEPISKYILQYRIHGTTFWNSQYTISPPRNYAILTGLTAGTEYDVRVRAVSAVGDGNWSAVQTERTQHEFFSMIPQPSGTYMLLDYHNFYYTKKVQCIVSRNSLMKHVMLHINSYSAKL